MGQRSMQDELPEISTSIADVSDYQNLIERVKNKKIVMLGESSHGTQEFYEHRRHISNELIRHHGFDFIAVEGDWPACQSVHHHISGKSLDSGLEAITRFSRWPTWMWGNTEMVDLMGDLKSWNEGAARRVGFYGLDVYSLYESMDEVVNQLNQIDPILALKAKHLYACFEPFKNDEKSYARSLFQFPEGCEQKVSKALESILEAHPDEQDRFFDIIQNARIVKTAERYYNTMISQDEVSWNVRDRHMMDTLDMLLDHYGPTSKGIVWAHNTHIGDYRATDMALHGQVNLGGLAREKHGAEQVSLIGFTTFIGQVTASHSWDGPTEVIDVPRAKSPSLEHALHQYATETGQPNFYLDFHLLEAGSSFNDFIGHRAIGVVYTPEHESAGNYVPSIPAQRYDALVFFDKTTALTPLNVAFEKYKIPETYPFGNRI